MKQQERIDAMAAIMVKARGAQADIGNMLAAALYDAAQNLGDPEQLVSGRPGCWEADIVRKMASAGKYARQLRGAERNEPYVQQLVPFLVEMGQAGEDGGDVLSQAMGQAVNTLGGLRQFIGASVWAPDLANIGCQYSNYPYSDWQPSR